MKIRATVNTPWARAGEEFEVKAPDANQKWALHRGTLERVDTPKKAEEPKNPADAGDDSTGPPAP